MHLFTTYLSTFYAAMYVLLDIAKSPSGRPCTLLPSRLYSFDFCDRFSFAVDIFQQNMIQYRTKLLLNNILLAESFLSMYLSSTLSLSLPIPIPLSLPLPPPLSCFSPLTFYPSGWLHTREPGRRRERRQKGRGALRGGHSVFVNRAPHSCRVSTFLLYYLFYLF